MKLILTGRGVDITPAVRQMVTRRLARLQRALGDALISTQVVLKAEKYRMGTEVTMHMRGGHILSGLGAATTWQMSLKDAIEHIEQQAQKVKDRWTKRKRRATGGKRLPVPLPVEADAEDAERVIPRIYRARGAVRPLTIDDAAAKFHAGSEPFLVFRNADTGRVAVVYRRKDGHVALLEPESRAARPLAVMAIVSPSVTVATLLSDRSASGGFPISLLSGSAGLDRSITHTAIQKTGLALAGYDAYLHSGRVLVFGESEVRFLESLDAARRTDALRRTLQRDIPCVLVTDGLTPPPELLVEGEAAAVPILHTTIATPVAINRLMSRLEDQLAPRELVHGVLLDILGLGVLLVGDSGIGKSECALDLVVRGHRLVADDAVEVRRRVESVVIGTSPELTRHHMELRGIGLINVRDMFGVASTRRSKRVELVVQMERWDPETTYERLGLDEHYYDVIGVPIPFVRMPVAPGRNLAILIEVAARNQLLRARGRNAARALVDRVDRKLVTGVDDADDPWGDQEEER